MTMKRLFAFLFAFATLASAHDLYLIRDDKAGQARVCARIGEEFPVSMGNPRPESIEFFRATGGEKAVELKGELEADAKQICAPLPKADSAVEMMIQPRYIKLKPVDFNEYIHGEGLRSIEKLRAPAKQREGREMYSRYTKSVIGASAAEATRNFGHVLEIVPEKDPATLKANDDLPVRVFFRGKPLADAQIAAIYSGEKLEGHSFNTMARTDKTGRARLKVTRGGLWYARMIYMVPANDPDFEWRSFFATVTFEVGPRAAAKAPLKPEAPRLSAAGNEACGYDPRMVTLSCWIERVF